MEIDNKTIKDIKEVLMFNLIIFDKAREDKKAGIKDKFLANQMINKIKSILNRLE